MSNTEIDTSTDTDASRRAIPLESDKPGLETARTITSLSADTLKRNYPKLVIKLSERREGMLRGDAYKIAAGKI